MAIFKQIEVQVLVNGKPVVEYDDPANDVDRAIGRDEDALIEKYIESKAGSRFAVQCTLGAGYQFPADKTFDLLGYGISIDGEFTRHEIFNESYINQPRTIAGITGKRDGQWQHQNFEFAKLQFSETVPTDSCKPGKVASLGIIEVKVERRRLVTKDSSYAPSLGEKFATSKLTENTLKGSSTDTVARLGAAETTSEPVYWRTKSTHVKPLVIFRFRYHTRETLQNLGIIERPRPPTPLEEKPIDSLTAEQLRELVRRKNVEARQQEDTSKLLKRRLREAQNQNNLRKLKAITGEEGPEYDSGDDECRVVKKRKEAKTVTVVELDSD